MLQNVVAVEQIDWLADSRQLIVAEQPLRIGHPKVRGILLRLCEGLGCNINPNHRFAASRQRHRDSPDRASEIDGTLRPEARAHVAINLSKEIGDVSLPRLEVILDRS